MKPYLLAALALAGVCLGQTTEEEKFYADYAKSEQQAIAAFPQAADATTPLSKRIGEIDKALGAAKDPTYYSSDKPLILARRAAKELGILPVDAKPDLNSGPSGPVKLEGESIPELNGYKSVTIRRVEPDGLRIMHDSGAAKIPIEKLSEEQRAKYGLTVEAATQYRKQLAEAAATNNARDQEMGRNQATAPRGAAPPPTVKFITAEQVKSMWIRRLPQPRSLDANYSKIMKSYKVFVADIRAGKRDLDAQETAATYNKAKAIEIGNTELARVYEAELGRIAQAKQAAAELAQKERQAQQDQLEYARLNSQLESIDRKVRDIKNSLDGW